VSSTRLTTSSTSDRHLDVADHAERPLVAKLYQLTGPLSSPTIDERRVSSPHDEKAAFYPPVSASKNSVPNSDIRDRFNDWVGVGSAIGIERVTPEQYHATIAASSSAYSTGCCQCNCDALGRARQRWTGIGHSSDVAAGTRIVAPVIWGPEKSTTTSSYVLCFSAITGILSSLRARSLRQPAAQGKRPAGAPGPTAPTEADTPNPSNLLPTCSPCWCHSREHRWHKVLRIFEHRSRRSC
jgi:hypothetical protein